MNLTLQRHPAEGQALFGRLEIDGAPFCVTLERVAVAIPAGTYPVVVTPSARAKAGGLWSPSPYFLLPLVTDVPGRSGIRFHAGNLPEQSDGCILVGRVRAKGVLVDSRKALGELLAKLYAAPDAITLEVRDA